MRVFKRTLILKSYISHCTWMHTMLNTLMVSQIIVQLSQIYSILRLMNLEIFKIFNKWLKKKRFALDFRCAFMIGILNGWIVKYSCKHLKAFTNQRVLFKNRRKLLWLLRNTLTDVSEKMLGHSRKFYHFDLMFWNINSTLIVVAYIIYDISSILFSIWWIFMQNVAYLRIETHNSL